MVVLNVGGQLHTTTTATLQSPLAKGSMLERLVSLHVQQQQTQEGVSSAGPNSLMQAALEDATHPGSLFIDRNGSLFCYVLDYLRSG